MARSVLAQVLPLTAVTIFVGGLGRPTAWHLPGGPVGPQSNVEVGQTTYPVNRGGVVMEGREWSNGQSHKEEEREGGSGIGREPATVI